MQIINYKKYDDILNRQHMSQSFLKAERGNILAYDKSHNEVKLTENISMYNVFIDPKYIGDKERFIEIFWPVAYTHLCETNGMEKVDKIDCIKNLEIFAKKDLLPKTPEFFYMGSGIVSDGYDTYDRTGYYEQTEAILSGFNTGTAETLVRGALEKRVQMGIKEENYIGFFSNKNFLAELEGLELKYINIKYNNYVYIVPTKITNVSREGAPLKKLLNKYGYLNNYPDFDKNFYQQEYRYIKLLSNVNPVIAQMIKDLKIEHYNETTKDRIPILHGLGLETFVNRYYPYGSFLSNVLGYVDKNGVPFYGIEQYFDDMLRGKDGKIIGRASAWIGGVGANEFEIEDVINGNDVYLTIDIGIQKEVELMAKKRQESLRADSVSILIYNPSKGQVKASINYPSFDPNNYNDVYTLKPLGVDESFIVDNDTYMDVPIYIISGGETKLATTTERTDLELKKYVTRNIFGPQVFVDKNISMAYEPGSIFKAFTMAIGLDTDEIRLYDFYNDPGEVKVGPYTIKNADNKNCMGDKSFMNAFAYSCNIGMVRIVQAVGKNNFYNYLNKLNFGQMTNIELAGEDPGSMDLVTVVSMARFLNNSFGQGLLSTPIQLAAAYGAIVNGGYYVKPTIIAGTYDKQTGKYHENKTQVLRQIFKPETAEEMKEALFMIMETNPDYVNMMRVEGFTLGGKSGTSQISFRGSYMQGLGWTNTSFIGLVTKENPEYVVVVQVRRPRATIWGAQTAGKIFSEVGKFLIGYSFIEK
ncbi:MAG: penicillin-binding protein 2 [Candidatus Absconditabacterales bacterium]|nr:penicillin-binding protein 2 [Candidatus Absconditabacterales bacterium]